tara:strand:- start:135 stop:743 length:609 start_codon:yes stop_codon:yes gene_type:complete
MSKFQRPLVARTAGDGYAIVTDGVMSESGSSYQIFLTSFKMSTNTESVEVIEEDFDADGGSAEGVARNIDGSDVVHHVSLGYLRGTAEIRGFVPFNHAIGLTESRFVSHNTTALGLTSTGAVESATKIFEVEVRLASTSTNNAPHKLKFKMIFDRFDIDWSMSKENVEVLISGKLTGRVNSGAYSSSDEAVSFVEEGGTDPS